MTYLIDLFSTHPTKLCGLRTFGRSSTLHNSSPIFWLSFTSTVARVGPNDKAIDVLTINMFTNANTSSSFHESS